MVFSSWRNGGISNARKADLGCAQEMFGFFYTSEPSYHVDRCSVSGSGAPKYVLIPHEKITKYVLIPPRANSTSLTVYSLALRSLFSFYIHVCDLLARSLMLSFRLRCSIFGLWLLNAFLHFSNSKLAMPERQTWGALLGPPPT